MPAEDERDEVDLRVYAHRVVARWWIVAICVLGAVLAFVFGNSVDRKSYEGRSLVSLGVPLTASGQVVTGAYSNSPIFAQTLTRQPEIQAEAARAAGLPETALRGRVSVVPVTSVSKTPITTQVTIVVQGPWDATKVGAAAQSLAQQVVDGANVYADTKKKRLTDQTTRLQQQATAQQSILDTARASLATLQSSRDATPLERAVIQNGLLSTITSTTSLLLDLQSKIDDLNASIENIDAVEKARIVTPARGVRADTTSQRASILVAIAIGLVAGVLLTLLSFVVRPAGD